MSGRINYALQFALATAMRAGEICGLRHADVRGNVATLAMTKNGTARDVPLSSAALAILAALEPLKNSGNTDAATGLIFGLKTSQLDASFRAARARDWKDLRFTIPAQTR